MRKLSIILILLLLLPSCARKNETVRFIFMTDMHVESDFMERGRPCYDHYQVGNHASLERTFQFINEDPFCSKAGFILLGGDNINTGYAREQADLEAEMVNYHRLMDMLDQSHNQKDLDSFRLEAPESYICKENIAPDQEPMLFHSPALTSHVIAIQGNHDTDVPEFYRDCAFQYGGIRFICFFAYYCALPAPPGKYRSTGAISDDTYNFVRDQVMRAAADPSIRQTVLVCHWGIVTDPEIFKNPIVDACEANGWNDNRAKLLALAEEYGIRLYISGHEHNDKYPVGKVGQLYNINCGSLAEGKWSVVEISPDKALFHVYTRAQAAYAEDGSVVFTALPEKVETIVIPLD